MSLDARVRECATILQDQKLLAKLSDLVAIEAKYHPACLVSLYNRARTTTKETEHGETDSLEGIALAELVMYIEEARIDEDVLPIFKLADLASMYTNRLQQLGIDLQDRVHTTRLKERILAMVPDLQAYKQGRDVLLVYEDDVGKVLSKVHQECYDDDAMHLARAANIVRKAMFEVNNSFNGTFAQDCQSNYSVPALLLSLVNMILYGPNLKSQSECSIENLPNGYKYRTVVDVQ